MKRIITLFCFLSAVLCILAQPADYVWTTPGRDASESMPCGGGDIGMNVWVEDGELLFYISRSGAFDEHNTLLKQGRVRVRVDGAEHAGMLNIGVRPTVDNGRERSVEVHILHFSGDLYGHRMRVTFVQRIRNEQKFAGLDGLMAQLCRDAEEVERIFSNPSQS